MVTYQELVELCKQDPIILLPESKVEVTEHHLDILATDGQSSDVRICIRASGDLELWLRNRKLSDDPCLVDGWLQVGGIFADYPHLIEWLART